MNANTTVFIDMGHSQVTPGKKSPDGSLEEWKFNRLLGRRIIEELIARGVDARPTTQPEEDDREISLTTRASRANQEPKSILISIHSNAAGDGSNWCKARGWEVYVARKCSWKSIQLATCLYESVEKEGFRMRPASALEKFRRANFSILTRTSGPAVLTESLFYDNKEDLAMLKDPEVQEKLVRAHVDGIVKYLSL